MDFMPFPNHHVDQFLPKIDPEGLTLLKIVFQRYFRLNRQQNNIQKYILYLSNCFGSGLFKHFSTPKSWILCILQNFLRKGWKINASFWPLGVKFCTSLPKFCAPLRAFGSIDPPRAKELLRYKFEKQILLWQDYLVPQ